MRRPLASPPLASPQLGPGACAPASEGAPSAAAGPVLSVVIPAFDEADSIVDLVQETAAALASLGPIEILVVDDGSGDATLERVRALQARGGLPLRILHHRRHAGQSAALRTGIAAARAAWVATLDGDAQNDPADIPRLLDLVTRDGAPADLRLVCGWRRRRVDTWSKRVASRVANAVRSRVLGDATPDTGCGLKLIHRATFLELPFFDHLHRFLPALVAAAGGRVVSVEVKHRPRTRGRSKYGLADRLWVGLFDLFGVLWLRQRTRPCVADEIRTGGPS